MQFINTPLVVEQDNYANQLAKSLLKTSALKIVCLVRLVRNSDKKKYLHNGYGIPFDGKGSWSFSNDFARNF